MDPYLEAHWRDVHTKLVAYTADAMNQILPEDLAAESEEYVAVAADDGTEQRFAPDVRVIESVRPLTGAQAPVGAVATLSAPVRLVLRVEPATERSVRIIESATQTLITVIEFVSPSNKRGQDMIEFQEKRSEFLAGGVNFVEVDLVRAGNWQALLRPHICPPQFVTPYRVTIRTPRDPGAVGLYPIGLRDPLPPVVIPLRPKDPQVQLELQPLIEQAYANGRYGRRLDYSLAPEPALQGEDEAWSTSLLKTTDGSGTP